MTRAWILGLALGAMLASTNAGAGEVTVVSDILGPEGPLYIDGALYYVGWISGTLSKFKEGRSVTLNNEPNCGHNGLALTAHKTFLLACTDDPGAILELDMTGRRLRRWDADAAGKLFTGGINDVVVTAAGGAYATIWGPSTDAPTAVIGGILYLAPGAKDWVQVADGLDYANGVGVSPDQKTLYVSETVGNIIQSYAISPDGSLSHRANFALLNLLTKNRVESWWLGPDSMKVNSRGDIYVAQWYGGKILKLSPAGKLLHVFDIAAGYGTTNLAFSPDGKDLYVTVVKDPADPKALGSIVRIPNIG
jgi:gluconolactonase